MTSIALDLVVFFLALFFAIVFIQSGFDKVFNISDNYSFLKSHFKQTILRNYVFFMLIIITVLECLTGIVLLLGLFLFVFNQFDFAFNILTLGFIMSNLTIICLFMGQRIAKDYVGAASLTGYFILSILSLFCLNFI
tara:strand:- start:2223 stop:2633 length:411 start_codon:yes stop_codon:yes gene_type:complete